MTPPLRFLRLIAADFWRGLKSLAWGVGQVLLVLSIVAALFGYAYLTSLYRWLYLTTEWAVCGGCALVALPVAIVAIGSVCTWITRRWKDSQS